MSGTIPASIKTIVNDLQDVKWTQVIFEAITNSLQANATKIDIKFFPIPFLGKMTDKPSIDYVIVEDNGDGFNEKNIKSFKEYRSQYKRDLGCKGIGRFLFLKVFDKIEIESLNKKINFVIDKDIEISDTKNNSDTKLFLKKPKNSFSVDYEKLDQDLKDHFIAYFKLLNKEVIINIYDNEKLRKTIASKQIPKFETTKFQIKKHEFTLDYVFNDNSIKNYDGFYCAGNRVVIKNSLLETNKKFKSFKNINILYLLSSEYFDKNVNNTRDDFIIMPKRKGADLFSDISWEDIHCSLTAKIKEISKKHNININEESEKSLSQAKKKVPFLTYYLKDNEDGLEEEVLIKNAKKRFEEDKDILRNKTKNSKEDFEYILGIVTQTELAEYIFDRQKKIDILNELTSKDALEKEIHNLFMKQKTKDENQNYKSNNLWLFDDRFMSYDKAFSEAQLKEIFPKLSENIKKPDILTITSNTYNKEKITDIVIIELKRPNNNITPAGAEEQLLRYAKYINDSRENKIRIWTYAFLNFTADTEFDLDAKSYNKIPVKDGFPIYYYYHPKPNTIINFMDYKSLACDANTRNKIFMKILKGETI